MLRQPKRGSNANANTNNRKPSLVYSMYVDWCTAPKNHRLTLSSAALSQLATGIRAQQKGYTAPHTQLTHACS
jgi:hypothetical protein